MLAPEVGEGHTLSIVFAHKAQPGDEPVGFGGLKVLHHRPIANKG